MEISYLKDQLRATQYQNMNARGGSARGGRRPHYKNPQAQRRNQYGNSSYQYPDRHHDDRYQPYDYEDEHDSMNHRDSQYTTNSSTSNNYKQDTQRDSQKISQQTEPSSYQEERRKERKPIIYNSSEKLYSEKDQDPRTSKRKTGETKKESQETPKKQRSTNKEIRSDHDNNKKTIQQKADTKRKNYDSEPDTLECFVSKQDLLDFDPDERDAESQDEVTTQNSDSKWGNEKEPTQDLKQLQHEINTLKNALSENETALKQEKEKVSNLNEFVSKYKSAYKSEVDKGKNMKAEMDELQKQIDKLGRINSKLTNLRERGDQIVNQFVNGIKSENFQKQTPEDAANCTGHCKKVIENLEENVKILTSEDYLAKQQHLHSALEAIETLEKKSRDFKKEDKTKLEKCEKYLGKLLNKISEAQAYWANSLLSKDSSPQQAMNIYSNIKAAHTDRMKEEFERRLDFLQRYIENEEAHNDDNTRLKNKILDVMNKINEKTDVYSEQSTNVFYWALVQKHCQTVNLKHIIFNQRCRYLCKQFPELRDQIISDTKHCIEEDILHVPKIYEEVDVSDLETFMKMNYVDTTRLLPKMVMTTKEVDLGLTCQPIPPVCNIEDIQSNPCEDLIIYEEEATSAKTENPEE